MKSLTEILETRRISVTPERKMLFERLEMVDDHFDAEELYVQMKVEGLPVSRATLYRTLELLVEVGYLRRLTLGRGKARYEKLDEGHLHGHLYCTTCGAVTDFPLPDMEALRLQALEDYGFKAELPELKLAGKCRQCQK